jgi:hypothetical protein
MTILCYFFGQKYYPIPYNITKLLGYIIVTVFLSYAVNFVVIGNQWLATGFHMTVIAIFSGVIFLIERKDLIGNRA